MKIETTIFLVESTSQLKANAIVKIITDDIYIDINDINVIQNKDGVLWVSLPNKKYTDNQGVDKYKDTVRLSKALSLNLKNSVLKEYRFKTQSIPPTSSINTQANETEVPWDIEF